MSIYEKEEIAVFEQRLQDIAEIAAGITCTAFIDPCDIDYPDLLAGLDLLQRELPEMLRAAKAAAKIMEGGDERPTH